MHALAKEYVPAARLCTTLSGVKAAFCRNRNQKEKDDGLPTH